MKLDGSIGTFVQKVNTLTGRMGWVLEDEYYDYHQEIARSMYADMLHDTDRNEKYYSAIKKAIDEMHAKNKKAHVLDIGTGTGLLSMMAANCGADTIVACEGFPPMADIAKCLLQDNCLANKIKVISKRSTQLRVGVDLDHKANILVTEVFDTELIGEGAIETFNHANEHLLEDDAIVIPSAARVYCQVIESDLLQSANKIRPKFLVLHGNELRLPRNMVNCTGTCGVHDIQLDQIHPNDVKILSSPLQIFKFDFCKSVIPYNETSKISFEALTNGMCTSVAFWWELDMDAAGETVISIAPSFVKVTPWRDHWMQAIYHLHKTLPVKQGAQLELVASHDKYSNFFHLFEKQSTKPIEELGPPSCTCGLHTSISRTRLMAVNDLSRWLKYLKVLANLPRISIAVYIGDFSLLPFAVASIAHKVYCIEENPVTYNVMENIIKENNLSNKVIILKKYDKVMIEGDVDVVLSEPYFRDTIYPWDNCRIWFMWHSMASKHTMILPSICKIYALPLQLDHLHKIRSPCRQVCGFSLHAFDKLIEKSSERSDNDVETQPLWEYSGIALATSSLMAEYNFEEAPPESVRISEGTMDVKFQGTCNGIAIWIDWLFGEETITTGPISQVIPGESVHWDKGTRQGIYFMKNTPPNVVPGNQIKHEVILDPVAGNFLFDFRLKEENPK
ncbi:arginine methyltransferase 7 isoform X2 [Rhodnius prolixus]